MIMGCNFVTGKSATLSFCCGSPCRSVKPTTYYYYNNISKKRVMKIGEKGDQPRYYKSITRGYINETGGFLDYFFRRAVLMGRLNAALTCSPAPAPNVSR